MQPNGSTERDVVVVGGGLVGLATADALTRKAPGLRLTVLEKEARLSAHQSGRNSGVLHSGIYYRPGSLKARTAVAGRRRMLEFCTEHGITHRISGKVIVATQSREVAMLERLAERARANGVGVERLGPVGLADIEPYATGIAALRVADAGVVDFAAVSATLRRLLIQAGAEVRTDAPVRALTREGRHWRVAAGGQTLRARWIVNCAGLHADRMARMAGQRPEVRIVAFRGEYFDVVAQRAELVRALIYPVPDPALPFLGVHLTRGVHGGVHAGPNAVLALAREGYRRADVDLAHVASLLRDPALWRLGRRYWRTGLGEVWRSLYKPATVAALRRLVPAVRAEDLVPAAPGVRAQALDRGGALVDDFVLAPGPGIVSVLNAPSPAATASLAIGEAVAEHVDLTARD